MIKCNRVEIIWDHANGPAALYYSCGSSNIVTLADDIINLMELLAQKHN